MDITTGRSKFLQHEGKVLHGNVGEWFITENDTSNQNAALAS